MKCIDCIEKGDLPPEDAELYLINEYDSVRPLCQGCFDDYAYMEGEMNLDFYSIEIKGIGQETFIKRINEVLKYLNEMNTRYSDRYFAAKNLVKNPDHGDFISKQKLDEALKW